MAAQLTPDDHPLVRHLESVATLSHDEKRALVNLPMQVVDIKTDQEIVREGDRPTRSCLILEGFACTFKHTGDGKRQIMAFGIAGDIPDLQSLHLDVLDNSVSTLTPCRVGFITHDALYDLCEDHPRITAAFWRKSLIEGAVFREWVMNVGRREAYNRIAHLFCELMVRLRAVGLAEDYSCHLPITQAEFADAIGVTTVHLNRVLREMRANGIIELSGDRLTIPDWDRLKEAGDFDPTYLHLDQAAA